MAQFPDFFVRLAQELETDPPNSHWSAEWTNSIDDFTTPESHVVTVTRLLEIGEYAPDDAADRMSKFGLPGWGNHGTETISVYVPWHLHPERWGIYFMESELWRYAEQVSCLSRLPRQAAGHLSVLSVLQHEYTHFEVEVLATQLEALHQGPLYLDYLSKNYQKSTPFGQPLEEALATCREVEYALKPGGPFKAGGKAIGELAKKAPAGYAQWANVKDLRDKSTAEAILSTVIAVEPHLWQEGLTSTSSERSQVPVRWVAADYANPDFPKGVLSKTGGPVTIGDFVKWLKKSGFTLDKGRARGDHTDVVQIRDSRRERVTQFDSNGGRNSSLLYRDQADPIARALGLPNAKALWDRVRNMQLIEPPVSQYEMPGDTVP